MKQTVLYDEGYGFDVKLDQNEFTIHFDYGTRYNKINMDFSHFHPFYEIYFLLSGNAQHFIEGECFNLDAHDFVFLKPYRLHRSSYFEYQPCKRMIISFYPESLNALFPNGSPIIKELFESPRPIYRFDKNLTANIISLLNDMYKASRTKGKTANILITSYFLQMIDLFYSHQIDNSFFNQSSGASIDDDSLEGKIYNITSYIHKNSHETLTLETIAGTFFISPHYLSRKFKEITGFTLIQYIQETRIKRAQEYLLDTDMKVTDIMDACGFGSISQFNRVFNSLIGCTPSEFRSKNSI